MLDAAREHGGAIPVVPLPGLLAATCARSPTQLVGVQTPQAFRAGPLLAAHRAAAADGFEGTDTAACFERYADVAVVAVPSSAREPQGDLPGGRRLADRAAVRPVSARPRGAVSASSSRTSSIAGTRRASAGASTSPRGTAGQRGDQPGEVGGR